MTKADIAARIADKLSITRNESAGLTDSVTTPPKFRQRATGSRVYHPLPSRQHSGDGRSNRMVVFTGTSRPQ
jgi:hypothetical protein